MNKWIIIGAAIFLFIALLVWLFIESSKPIPGIPVLQDGRKHLAESEKIDYKFNPPTSGDHYPSWITKGFYDTPRMDGNLVHSQEHGYIIFWYDCEKKVQSLLDFVKTVYGQESSNSANIQMTSGSEGSASASLSQLPKSFSDGSCDGLKNQLKELYNKFGHHKLIVTPRERMDHVVILTAWGKMLKLNSLDQNQIKEFIDAYRDGGPEATNEP